MKRPLLALVALPAMLAGASVRPAQDAARDAEAALAALSPSDPRGYFRAGERLIEQPTTAVVGRETLALGVLLAAETDPELAASAAIALASAAGSRDEFARLWSLAVDLDPTRSGDRVWARAGDGRASDRDVARTLGGLRLNSSEALSSLSDHPDRRDRIVETGERLGFDPSRVRAVLSKWERDAADDPCRGRMVLRTRTDAGFRDEPCPEPAFHHGVELNADWSMMVGIELALLGTAPDSWPGQAAVGLDAAVPSWTLASMARAYGVSADRPVRRAGRWTPP
jgi:hypothetical protein